MLEYTGVYLVAKLMCGTRNQAGPDDRIKIMAVPRVPRRTRDARETQ